MYKRLVVLVFVFLAFSALPSEAKKKKPKFFQHVAFANSRGMSLTGGGMRKNQAYELYFISPAHRKAIFDFHKEKSAKAAAKEKKKKKYRDNPIALKRELLEAKYSVDAVSSWDNSDLLEVIVIPMRQSSQATQYSPIEYFDNKYPMKSVSLRTEDGALVCQPKYSKRLDTLSTAKYLHNNYSTKNFWIKIRTDDSNKHFAMALYYDPMCLFKHKDDRFVVENLNSKPSTYKLKANRSVVRKAVAGDFGYKFSDLKKKMSK